MAGFTTSRTVCPGKQPGETVANRHPRFRGSSDLFRKNRAIGSPSKCQLDSLEPLPDSDASLVISGGRAPEYLRLKRSVFQTVVASLPSVQTVIAANPAHGPQNPRRRWLLVRAASAAVNPAVAPEINRRGGEYNDSGRGHGHGHVEGQPRHRRPGPPTPRGSDDFFFIFFFFFFFLILLLLENFFFFFFFIFCSNAYSPIMMTRSQ